MKHIYKLIVLVVAIFSIMSCVEKYEPQTTSFESILVVEATITNEYKKHQVKLSRTIPIDSIIPDSEKNALVKVKVSNGNEYNFTEIEAGLYESVNKFKAEPNLDYQLYIQTEDGEEYISSQEQLTASAPIEKVYAQKETINAEEGVQVFVENQNNPKAKYFRYEYDETYKIVTPYRIVLEPRITDVVHMYTKDFEYRIRMKYSDVEKQVCYSTNKQQNIIINANKEARKKVRFINNYNMLRNRYSILVKQYVINKNAYFFFNKMHDLNKQHNLFSSIQSGYIVGNIQSTHKVLGFFNISSYSEKRIYFNYNSFNMEQPKYLYDCQRDFHPVPKPENLDYLRLSYADKTTKDGDLNERVMLYDIIIRKSMPLRIFTEPWGDFYFVKPECGDCTTFSSNIKPDFWVD